MRVEGKNKVMNVSSSVSFLDNMKYATYLSKAGNMLKQRRATICHESF